MVNCFFALHHFGLGKVSYNVLLSDSGGNLISESSLNVSFLPASLTRAALSVSKSAFAKVPWLQTRRLDIPSGISSITVSTFGLNFTSSVTAFSLLCCTFILVCQVFLPIIHFCRMSWGLSLASKDATWWHPVQLYCMCRSWVTDVLPHQSLTGFERGDAAVNWLWCTRIIYTVSGELERVSSQGCAIIHS